MKWADLGAVSMSDGLQLIKLIKSHKHVKPLTADCQKLSNFVARYSWWSQQWQHLLTLYTYEAFAVRTGTDGTAYSRVTGAVGVALWHNDVTRSCLLIPFGKCSRWYWQHSTTAASKTHKQWCARPDNTHVSAICDIMEAKMTSSLHCHSGYSS